MTKSLKEGEDQKLSAAAGLHRAREVGGWGGEDSSKATF